MKKHLKRRHCQHIPTPPIEPNMNTIEQMEQLVASARSEAETLYNGNKQVAATRLRKKMQELKSLCQTCRVEALDYQKQLKQGGRERRSAAAAAEPVVEAAGEGADE